jgi:hypothetical protein
MFEKSTILLDSANVPRLRLDPHTRDCPAMLHLPSAVVMYYVIIILIPHEIPDTTRDYLSLVWCPEKNKKKHLSLSSMDVVKCDLRINTTHT